MAQNSPKMANNPDMIFNRAMIHKFLEEYQASHDEFLMAYNIDPSLTVAVQYSNQIKQQMSKVQQLLTSKVCK